jgi:protein CpxP
MKSHRMKIFLAAVAIVLVGAVGAAQTVRRAGYRHGDGMFGEHMLAFYAHRLDLTDAQQSQLKDIMAREKPTLKPLFQQLAQTRHQMRTLEEGDTFNEAQVRALATQQSQTMTELIVQKARIKSEMLQVLNPDQKAKFKQMMDKHEQRMMDGLQNQSTDTQHEQQN